MNDESSVPRQPPRALGDENARDRGRTRGSVSVPDATRRQRRKSGLSKKLQFMIHLLKSLDMLFFAEICVLYYMECSLPRMVLRVIPHYLFFTPKADTFLQTLGPQRPQVFAIFAPNLLCVLAHIIWGPTLASEANRGYLHGGIIVDFIGQKPPVSRFGLLALDLLILGLQCFMLAVHQEAERLWKAVRPQGGAGAGTVGISPAPPTTQDHDAEERGVLRDTPGTGDPEDIELRPIASRTAAGSGSDVGAASMSWADLADAANSGNIVLADYHVVNAIRMAGNDYQSAASYSLQSIGYTATLAALAAERRARLAAPRRQ